MCLMDDFEMHRFTFDEEYNIEKIKSKIKKDPALPNSGIIA